MKYSVLSLFLLVDIVSLAHGKTPHENKDEDETSLTSSSSALEVKFNFESGTLGRWKVVAGEFGDLVTGRKFFHKKKKGLYVREGMFHLSTLDKKNGRGNDGFKGVIVSPAFKLKEPSISFMVGGGKTHNTYVALCDIKGTELLKAHGKNSEDMHRVNWDAGPWLGQPLYLKVNDASGKGWGHLTLDDVQANGTILIQENSHMKVMSNEQTIVTQKSLRAAIEHQDEDETCLTCSSSALEVKFNFESGTLGRWKVVAGEFGDLVTGRKFFHKKKKGLYVREGMFHLSTLDKKNGRGNDGFKGVIVSPAFKLKEPSISFMVGGGKTHNTYVALCDIKGTELLKAHGKNSEDMHRVNWDAGPWLGQPLYLKVNDASGKGWGHLTLDDVQANGTILIQENSHMKVMSQENSHMKVMSNEQTIVTPKSLRTAIEHLMAKHSEYRPKGETYLKQLQSLDRNSHELADLANQALVKSHPLLINRELLFVERQQYKPDHHNTGTIFQKGEINQNNFKHTIGASLKKYSVDNSKVTTLYETKTGMLRDPELNFDGDRFLFSYRKNFDDDYSIYEMKTDGTNFRALTSLGGVSDIDPFYLSNGDIVFSSTREPKYCACNRNIMANLFRMKSDGANIVQIGKSIEFEGHGIEMPDGRLLYNRWEYIDRNFGGAQGLWTSNSDGTNHALYLWQSTPHPLLNARPIPGTDKVVAIVSSCHDRPWGALAVLDRNRGIEGKKPIVKIWPESAIEKIADETVGYSNYGGYDNFRNLSAKYEDPFPISEDFFLVSKLIRSDKTAIFLVDMFGNEILVHEAEGKRGCYDPILIRSNPRNTQLVDRRDYSQDEGSIFVMNAYEGSNMEGVRPGSLKKLRVIDNPPKMTFTNAVYRGQGFQAPAMNYHDFDNKKVLAEIPIEEDGSVHFTIPSDIFFYLQLIDDEDKMVQSMRSGMITQPGERQSCVGCHEDRNQAPNMNHNQFAALLKPPHRITRDQVNQSKNYSFQEKVQPIFNNHCLSCHDYGKSAEDSLNLSGDKTAMFSVSYLELHQGNHITTAGAGVNKVLKAYEWGSAASPLVDTLEKGHHGVKLSEPEMVEIKRWIDLNAPYYPDYSSAHRDSFAGRAPITKKDHRQIGKMLSEHYHTNVDKNNWFKHNPFHYTTPIRYNFDRPEHSPILKYVKDPQDVKIILDKIRKGQQKLTETPRNDMPGYQPHPEDQRRLNKYQRLYKRELENRKSMLEGKRRYDPGIEVASLKIEHDTKNQEL